MKNDEDKGLVRQVLKSISALFYPRLCSVCDAALQEYEHEICLDCLAALPQCSLHKMRENYFGQKLDELFPCDSASAHLYLNDVASPVRQLLHTLKFYSGRELAITLGHQYGAKLRGSDIYAGVEAVVPVPLHYRREALRGYNQAECFAEGVAAELGVPVVVGGVSRIRRTRQQATRRSAEERRRNVAGAFAVTDADKLRDYGTLLLVDDVVTTGATISECGKAILAVFPEKRIYVGSIATKARG